jgi:hypothetical protein
MPTLTRVLAQEDLQRTARMSDLDLATYVEIIDQVRREGGVGGLVHLLPGESKRTEKRRLTLAAKQRGLNLTWRSSPPGDLRFVLSEPGGPVPGSRKRREPTAVPAAARRGRGRG